MSFAPNQIVHCRHQGRAATRERFVQVRVDKASGRDASLYWVQWHNPRGFKTEFVAAAADLGTLEELSQRWPDPAAPAFKLVS